jgi:hypothetical protein
MFRVLLLVLLLLAACARRGGPPALPETAPGGWRLTETKHDGSKTFGTYAGAGTIRVEVEDTGSSGVALDRAQRTRLEPDMVFFYKNNYFVIVRWEEADRDSVKAFVRDLEKRLESH